MQRITSLRHESSDGKPLDHHYRRVLSFPNLARVHRWATTPVAAPQLRRPRLIGEVEGFEFVM